MKLRDIINKLDSVDAISISGLCDEYYDGVDQLKNEEWYKAARNSKVKGISTLINGHMRAEMIIDIEE